MNQDQKTTWIQYFQYLHSQWCNTFADNLSIGKCVDKLLKDNVIITNFIEIFYRYKAFQEEVTNAFTIEFDITVTDPDNTFDVQYIQNGGNLFLWNGIKEDLLSAVVTELIAAGFECFENDGIIYVYTYDGSYTYADLPTINLTPSDPDDILSVTITSLENNLSAILDNMNCLTLEDMCDIKNRLLLLLNECNCN